MVFADSLSDGSRDVCHKSSIPAICKAKQTARKCTYRQESCSQINSAARGTADGQICVEKITNMTLYTHTFCFFPSYSSAIPFLFSISLSVFTLKHLRPTEL